MQYLIKLLNLKFYLMQHKTTLETINTKIVTKFSIPVTHNTRNSCRLYVLP